MSDKENKLIIDIGITITKLRKKKNLSQESLAELSEIHRTYLSEVEGGKRNPTISVLNRVVEALGISMSDFFQEVDRSSKYE
ncbi:helix-turn-helix domain-containing protein [Actinobacillus pleuropneumoniae]|uniref:helix-turn-helix domain-containing protein n=1 Tax=Actinobacillus pleuropneumoniae TaxID=715 RepID=UPI003CFDC9BF